MDSGAGDRKITCHALEPNGGQEEALLAELLRVARLGLVLVEPSYERATPSGRARMERLLRVEWCKPDTLAFALVQLARCTGDRTRDLDEELRQRVAERLAPLPSGQRWAKQVLEVVALEAKEQARILDESLPAGLRIRSEEG